MKPPKGVSRLRRWLVAGLLVWLPLIATIVVFKFLLDLMDQLLFLLPTPYRPENLLGFRIPGLGAMLALALLLLTGILGANLLGRLARFYEVVIKRIPLVGSVYAAFKNFAEVVFSDSTTSFKKVLLIEYPRKGIYSVAFQTSESAEEIQAITGETVTTVFLPTTPNPTSGFLLFVPRSQITELDMPVESAFKMIVSLGVVLPKWHPEYPSAEGIESAGVPEGPASSARTASTTSTTSTGRLEDPDGPASAGEAGDSDSATDEAERRRELARPDPSP